MIELSVVANKRATAPTDSDDPVARLSGKRAQDVESHASDSLVDESVGPLDSARVSTAADGTTYDTNLPAEQDSLRRVRIDATQAAPRFIVGDESHPDGVSIQADGARMASSASGYEMEVKRSGSGHLQVFIRRNIRKLPARSIRPGLWSWQVDIASL